MRHSVLAAAAAAALVTGVLAGSPAAAAPDGEIRDPGTATVVPDSFVVVLKNTTALRSRGVDGSAKDLAGRFAGTVGHVYTSALRGFSVTLPEARARQLAADPAVDYVQRNGVHTVSGTQPNPPSWGLDRVDQRNLPLDASYTYPSAASGVRAYIIDTGIRTSHGDFGGRASSGFDAVDGGAADDCNGHGTHVAGTVGGSAYGVAKGVSLIAVRVLNCAGSGTTAGVAAGIDWVTANAVRPAVANMSLGGGADATLDAAVRTSIGSGVSYAIAAGNSNGANACNYSPARVTEAITVGSTTSTDARSSFSNVGTCLDVFAPGSSITSAWHTGDAATNTISGTSMAAPHVAGAAALILAANPAASPAQVRDALVAAATPNKVTGAGTGSPNLLLFVGDVTPPQPGTTISLRARVNGLYVCAENDGASPLIANRAAIGAWEQFDRVDAGGGYIALRSHTNGLFVTAENAGASPLIANRPAIGLWEQFQIITNADGSVSLRAAVNGKYVVAESAGNASLIANRDAIGPWEKFDILT